MTAVQQILSWISRHETLLWICGGSSLFVLVAVMIAMPFIVLKMPPDYFAERRRRPMPWARQHPVIRAVLLTAKNLLGLLFVTAGVLMLFLPGQGVFTVLVGLTLMSFPGKYDLERRIIRLPFVIRPINWIRARGGRPPIQADECAGRTPVR